MAAMSTALTLFNMDNNNVTYSYSGHLPSDPRLVIQKRKLAPSSSGVAETTVKVVSGTQDADGYNITPKITFEAVIRTPIQGVTADIDAALVIFRDIIAGDEFTNSVSTQENLV
jgi:hypothetical protein